MGLQTQRQVNRGRHCWCMNISFRSSNNVLENHQPWLLKGWLFWVVWVVGVWKWDWGALSDSVETLFC